jgi:hypothetical protein
MTLMTIFYCRFYLVVSLMSMLVPVMLVMVGFMVVVMNMMILMMVGLRWRWSEMLTARQMWQVLRSTSAGVVSYMKSY